MPEQNLMKEKETWQEILRTQTQGSKYHMQRMKELVPYKELDGFVCLEKHHAKEELDSCLSLNICFIDWFKTMPVEATSMKVPELVFCENATLKDKMIKVIEDYEDWENDTLARYKQLKKDLPGESEYLEKTIQDVRKELSFICEMWDELESHNFEEEHLKKFNEWLKQHFK